MQTFNVVTLSPLYASHCELAMATLKAGGIAVVDSEFCPSSKRSLAARNLNRLCTQVGPEDNLGFRLSAEEFDTWGPIVEDACRVKGLSFVLLSAGSYSALKEALFGIAALNLSIWLEVISASQLEWIQETPHRFAAVVLKGDENGGWVGEESAFVMAQRLFGSCPVPAYVQGGGGPHVAAACRVAGAAGIVLQEQLLLLDESPYRKSLHSTLIQPHAERTTVKLACGERWLRLFDRKEASQSMQDLQNGLVKPWEVISLTTSETYIWPLGQCIGQAAGYKARFGRLGPVIRHLQQASQEYIRMAAQYRPLAQGSLMAQRLGTRYPIIQGPMTRVSDEALFLKAVATGGAMPVAALAMMKKPDARKLLSETKDLLGDSPWGAGLLCFLPDDLLLPQIELLEEFRPSFVLLAGGTPDHYQEMTRRGLCAFVHVPAASLLPLFLQRGVRRFVFEGQECGGHTGPLSSFVLWERALEVLLALPAQQLNELEVLFAGGIHDARSAAMVSAFAGSLAHRGCATGIVVGTAYLFTEEACQFAAIDESYQQVALQCDRTVVIETGKGHLIRCLPSPFINYFEIRRQQGISNGTSARDLTKELEELVQGRLRIASKGLRRSKKGLEKVSSDTQHQEGLYMIGQAAALHREVTTIPRLHQMLAEESSELLIKADTAQDNRIDSVPEPSDIAIIGMSTLLPKAQTLDQFWSNLLEKIQVISEIPKDQWDWTRYFTSPGHPENIISSKWGGFLDEVGFDPLRFGIPPNSLSSISPAQLLLLHTVADLLRDAGYENRPFDRKHTSVIVASDGSSALKDHYDFVNTLHQFSENVPDEVIAALPRWDEESFAGVLTNVLAGRVANRFDLGGANYALDAACASSLAAISAGVRELESGESNLVIVAAADLGQTPFSYRAFSETRALSPCGQSRPFSQEADGIVISEGLVAVLLKRRTDAERDGDRIYSVIRGTGSSSDGKGLGITAPNSEGQKSAMRRAYARAGFSPASLGLYEAHATGTVVGDKTELTSVIEFLAEAGVSPQKCAIGAAKAYYGHTKTSAGLVGLVKASLALYHRTLPPQGVDGVALDAYTEANCPVYLPAAPIPWTKGLNPRRAGISAFGFGGTNTHVLLEEYTRTAVSASPGGMQWPSELFLFAAPHPASLADKLLAFRESITDSATAVSLRFWALQAAQDVPLAEGNCRLAFVSGSIEELLEQLVRLSETLRQRGEVDSGATVSFRLSALDGKVAFLFPGQGSQHLQMGREAALFVTVVRESLEAIERLLAQQGTVELLSKLYVPTTTNKTVSIEQAANLADTLYAQPAIGALSAAYLELLNVCGIRPDMSAGHSYGELVALYAGGKLECEDFIQLTTIRAATMKQQLLAAGGMIAVFGPASRWVQFLEGSGLQIANYNSQEQHVVSGDERSLAAFKENLLAAKVRFQELNVAGPFHSTLYAAAAESFANEIRSEKFCQGRIPVYSNVTSDQFPDDPEAAAALFRRHLISPVHFHKQVEQMYADGARIFVEVGPKQILSTLVDGILNTRDHACISLDGGGLSGLLMALGHLFTVGLPLDIRCLFEGRLTDQEEASPSGPSLYYIKGNNIRQAADPEYKTPSASWHLGPAITPLLPPLGAGYGSEAELRLAAYTSFQETMKEFLRTQETVMDRFCDYVPPRDDTWEKPLSQTLVHTSPELSSQQGTRQDELLETASIAATALPDLKAHILKLISDRTGYPQAMLGHGVDLEAELGIDSIKRMEIVDGILSALPVESKDAADEVLPELLKTRTIGGWLDLLESAVTASQHLPLPSTIRLADAKATATCPRFVMASQRLPLPPSTAKVQLAGCYLLLPDKLGVAELLCKRIQSDGCKALVLNPDEFPTPESLKEFLNILAINEPQAQLRIVNMAALDKAPMPTDMAGWQKMAEQQVKFFFRLIRSVLTEERLNGRLQSVFAASMFGGKFGRGTGRSVPSPLGGAMLGLLQTLAKEHPEIAVRLVDFPTDLLPSEMCRRLAAELGVTSVETEIGYPDGERVAFFAKEEEVDNEAVPSVLLAEPDWVVLATGGAKGITARLCAQLIVPGVTLVLLGRTAEENLDSESCALLESWKQGGAQVVYAQADVRDEHQMGEIFQWIYQEYGRLDAVVHGAGVLRDQSFRQKSDHNFDEVFDTKVNFAFVLHRYVNFELLKMLVFLGSVSGRFGNQGQADYAAANEVLNRFAWQLKKRYPSICILTINWGPWNSPGMASPLIIKLLEAQGIKAIIPEQACAFFASEIQARHSGQVEIIAGDGPWRTAQQRVAGYMGAVSKLNLN